MHSSDYYIVPNRLDRYSILGIQSLEKSIRIEGQISYRPIKMKPLGILYTIMESDNSQRGNDIQSEFERNDVVKKMGIFTANSRKNVNLNNIDLNTINTGIANALAKATQAQTTATAAASQSNGVVQGVRLGSLLMTRIEGVSYNKNYGLIDGETTGVITGWEVEQYGDYLVRYRHLQILINGSWVNISKV